MFRFDLEPMSVKQVFNKNVDIQAYPVITGNFINANIIPKGEVFLLRTKKNQRRGKTG